MNFQKILILGSGLIAVAATFLPWKKNIFNGDISYTNGVGDGGWVVFILITIIYLLLLIYRKKNILKGVVKWAIVFIGMLIIGFSGIKFKEIAQIEVVDVPDQLFHIETLPGWGLYILAAMGIILIAASFIHIKKH